MTEASEGDFAGIATIAIVGVGLMGGSLARAIRTCWPDVTIVGIDRGGSEGDSTIAEAIAARAIDRGSTDAAAACDADLIFLAAPVLQNIACLETIASAATARGSTDARRVLVSDLGSTKQAIVEAARSLPAHVTFIGGHPMAGAAQGGFAAARADLFHGRPWILTPDGAPPDCLRTLEAFVRVIGAEPAVMSAAEHDRVMAFVSHLPQLTATSLMRVIGARVGAAGLAVSGPGLADSTRLASSPSGVWRDICRTNARPIAAALDDLIAELQQARRQLDTPNALDAWLTSWMDEGARWRTEMPR